MFLFGTADDKAGHSSLVLVDALRESKVPVEFHFLSTGVSSYGLPKDNQASETWPVLFVSWFKKTYLDHVKKQQSCKKCISEYCFELNV